MKIILITICTLLWPAPLLADAQTDHARRIAALSDTFAMTAPERPLYPALTDPLPAPLRRVHVMVEGCTLTQVELWENQFSGAYSGASLRADLSETAGPRDILNVTVQETRETLNWQHINSLRPGTWQVDSLVSELLAYQSEYCSLE